jgi:glycosyltransferase involved in cell wall biosynthesis
MIGMMARTLNPGKKTDESELVGSAQANYEYKKALLSFLPNNFMTLFAMGGSADALKSDLLRLSLSHHANCSSHNIVPDWDMPLFLPENRLNGFHNPEGAQLHRKFSYMRDQFSKWNYPITSLIHGLSYFNLQVELFESLLTAPILACDSIICTSYAAKEAFSKRLFRIAAQLHNKEIEKKAESIRTDMIPLGVDTDIYRPRDKADTRRILGLPQDKTIILYFGRVCVYGKMDPTPLLTAFDLLVRKHGESVHLVIAGNIGDYTAQQLNKILPSLPARSQIEIRDKPSLIEGPLYYSASDLYVSPIDTMTESFGISPLEAMSSGLPAVVSDWSGYHETVIHEKTGFHLPTYWGDCNTDIDKMSPIVPWFEHHVVVHQSVAVDLDALVSYMDLLVSNRELRYKMGDSARSHVIENYSWERVVHKMQDLWTELGKIAAVIPKDVPTTHPDEMKSYADFGHFASHEVTADDLVEITNLGQMAIQTDEPIQILTDLYKILSSESLVAILQMCESARLASNKISVDQIFSQCTTQTETIKKTVLAHILWLLKNGYVRIAKVC